MDNSNVKKPTVVLQHVMPIAGALARCRSDETRTGHRYPSNPLPPPFKHPEVVYAISFQVFLREANGILCPIPTRARTLSLDRKESLSRCAMKPPTSGLRARTLRMFLRLRSKPAGLPPPRPTALPPLSKISPEGQR